MCSTEKPTESIHIYSTTVLRVSPASDNQTSLSFSDLVPIQQKDTFGKGIFNTLEYDLANRFHMSTHQPSYWVRMWSPCSHVALTPVPSRQSSGWMGVGWSSQEAGLYSSRGYKHLINSYTPSENWHISPENSWLEDEVAFQNGPFSGDMLIFGR